MRHITVGGRPAGRPAAPSNEEGPSFPLTERHDWAEDPVAAAVDIAARTFLPNRLSVLHCLFLIGDRYLSTHEPRRSNMASELFGQLPQKNSNSLNSASFTSLSASLSTYYTGGLGCFLLDFEFLCSKNASVKVAFHESCLGAIYSNPMVLALK